MHRLKLILFLACFAMNFSFLAAETIYLQVDEGCTDRFEYVVNGNQQGDIYVSYVTKNGNQTVILEVAKENRKWTKERPSGLISCGALVINKRMIQKINAGETEIIMVRSTDTHYNLTSVKKAVFYEKLSQTIEVISKDANFVFNLNHPVGGIDIALPDSELDVYLEGSLRQQCAKGFIIKKSKGYKSESYKEMTIIPEIGIVEKRSISTSLRGGTKTSIIKLDKINDLNFSDYLNDKCTELQAAVIDNKNQPTEDDYDEEEYYSTDFQEAHSAGHININTSPSRPESFSKNSQKLGPCGKPIKDGFHVVSKGETLYRISIKYGVKVSEIQKMNGLTSNTINPCQELMVRASAPQKNNDTAFEDSRPSGETIRPNKPVSSEKYKDSQDYYRVKSGESIRSLARTYGYTEDRFRWMNGLSPTEDVYPGQVLRTSDCVCPEKKTVSEKRPQPYETPVGYDDMSRIVSGYASKGAETKRPKGTKLYTVRENDTLYSIARAFNTSVDNLMFLNNLSKGEIILPSQTLYVQ